MSSPTPSPLNWNSQQLTQGWQRGVNSFFWGLGFQPEDFHKAQVGIGTALSIRSKLGDRPPRPDEVEGVGRGAWAHAQTLHPTRYLQAVGEIHSFGREMAAFFEPDTGDGPDILLSAVLAEPPAKVGRFAHTTEDYVGFRTGPDGIFAYSPFCAIFNASGQPAASLPLGWSGEGLPIGIHLAAAFGQDELLISLCAEIERAAPWTAKRAPLAR